jgi:hypothetical protein
MKNMPKKVFFILFFFLFYTQFIFAQSGIDSAVNGFKEVKAGPQYKRSSFYQWLMGKNYRNEWSAAVKVPVTLLDTAKGGLTPYKAGGGHQTKSLHVKTTIEKQYAFRSVDKTLGKVLPEILHNTFLEDMVNDEVSMSHPYGAIPLPMMAKSAGIYHTLPAIVYLPRQSLLDTFSNKFGNKLYVFEQRMSGSWQEANNLGNFKEFIDTYELIDTLKKDNQFEVDQSLFIKSRLFDMFIGDWDRHEDQWRWGMKKINDKKVFQSIPQDRDQAYFKYDGVLLKLLISASGQKYFQAFDYKLPDVKTFNYEERNLDRFFANQMALNDWQSAAKNLQQALTDKVIESSVQQLPPEIFALSGKETIAKLKSRRDRMVEYATAYYRFIAKEVEVVGSKGEEFFEVSRLNDNETLVNVFRKTGEQKEKIPYYSRIFKTGETKEVRLYGLSGNDTYTLNGNVNRGIVIRIIGGDERDSIIDRSVVKGSASKTFVYDDANNFFAANNETKLHVSSDTGIHSYNYFSYLYDKKGVSPNIFYNYEDRLFAGINTKIIGHKWRQSPFAYSHNLALNYSISQHAVSATYQGIFPKAISKWDLLLKGNFDAIRWTKFFGLGNETSLLTKYNDFYRMQSREWLASVGLNRVINHNNISISTFFQSKKIINDPGRFVSKIYTPAHPYDLHENSFAGARVAYIFDHVNDSVVPTKGITFITDASYSHNLTASGNNFSRLQSTLQLYVPLVSKLSLSLKTSGLTVAGNPLFYQYVSIGGPETLRGYRLERFWGKTGFYNANELRYITNITSYVFNGKAGVLALFDQGRVWLPGEVSDAWHTSYGGGVLLAPFNKIQIVLTYAKSKEMKLFQLRVGRSF